jgi:long-chain fatty acid transport protein
MRRRGILVAILVSVAVCMLTVAPTYAAGFGIFEQGSKAMGMAGAFTAQADDPSALFHNAGGIAFQKHLDFAVGTTLIYNQKATFDGVNPFPGEGATGSQKKQVFYPSHVYYVQPLSGDWTFGLGINSPFGLTTEWEKPDTFPGRFESTKATLRTFDLNPTIAWQVSPTVGIGFGIVGRWSDVELNRRVGAYNPFINAAQEVAKVRLKSDLDTGYGWNIGILNRYNNSFSWGLSYRSKIKIDYKGDGRFTQEPSGNPMFDAAVANLLPFGGSVPITTSIEFPDLASLGAAFALSPNSVLEIDVNWTGWSSFDKLDINFTDHPLLSSTTPENYKDTYNYRIGYRWNSTSQTQWRFGYVYDQTPQPTSSVSPLLPDANRNGITVGYGHQGATLRTDLAFMYLMFDKRTTNDNYDNFNGTYETRALLLGITLGF